MFKKKWLKSSWTIPITVALISFLFSLLRDWIINSPILSTLSVIFNLIGEVFNYDLKVWWVISAIVIFVLLRRYVILKFTNTKPNYLKYTEDIFNGYKWSWTWIYNSKNKEWQIKKLKIHCKKCQSRMNNIKNTMYRELSRYECPKHCSKIKATESNFDYEIENLIYDNIRNNRAVAD